MLSKKYCLPGKRFPLLKNTDLVQTDLFGLSFLKNRLNKPRFGFIVSKKIDKRAVKRNRLKRLFKTAVAKNLDKFKNIDYLFLVKKSALGKSLNKIENEIKKIVEK